MKLDDEVYDECIEKIRKTMNFYGYQNREMADDILSDVSMPISRPLQETIRTQQATIERLLAVIAKKDAAITHALREHGGFTIKGETERICRDALAINPENVELVESK